jgi:glutamate-5-semialdehyde dehydrogenase
MAAALRDNRDEILAANDKDIDYGREHGLSESLLDRLRLTAGRIEGMAKGIEDIVSLPDPCGEVVSGAVGTQELDIKCVRVPLGVIGIIYEARPNVTSDAAALCFKSGNVCILRGGKEAINSNKAIAAVLRNAAEAAGFTPDCISLIEDTTRASAEELMRLTGYLDVLIPRGGAGLIRSVVENAKVPVIETGTGNCHAFVDESADLTMAANIIFNAKTSRPSVCNALETMLIHRSIAETALPLIKARLDEKNTVIKGCEETVRILGDSVVPASEEDFVSEALDYVISCKVVADIDEALGHIEKYSTKHSECIITSDYANSQRFLREVDSAAVYVNASTRFTDGGVFGLGAEIGISTQKLHARGPMGLRQLTSIKYIISGNGQIRE